MLLRFRKAGLGILLAATISTSDTQARPVPVWGGTAPTKITLTKLADLYFGGLFAFPASGWVVISPNPNTPASYSSASVKNSSGSIHAPQPARFKFSITNNYHCQNSDHCSDDDDECDRNEGDDNKSNDDHSDFTRHGSQVSITLPSSDRLYKSGSSSIYMTADHFCLLRTKGYFYVGAKLTIGANQPSGSYSGTFPVTIICE
jgi:hypothetical protein